MMRQLRGNNLSQWSLIIGFSALTAFKIWDPTTSPDQSILKSYEAGPETLKEEAFKILDNKCNVCHQRKNRRRVFTSKNMKAMAPDIYQQVFVKERMPLGKKIKLSEEEYFVLDKWIQSQN